MKCRDCKFLSEPQEIPVGGYPKVRCTRGEWDDVPGHVQWYSYGEMQLNRGPVRKLGESCRVGRPRKQ